MTFTEHLDNANIPGNIFCGPTTDKEAFEFICQYLLPKNWLTPNPVSHDQVNTEIVHDILMKYSKEYRKEYKKYIKGGK